MNTRQFITQTLYRSQLLSDVVMGCKYLFKHSPVAETARQEAKKRVSSYIQDKYDFGYFPTDEHLPELFKYTSEKTLKKLRLVYDRKIQDQNNTVLTTSTFNYHNLIWPIKDDYGHIVSLVGRSLLSKDSLDEYKIPKYKYASAARQTLLFGLNQAKMAIARERCVILVEGEMDCLACHAKGHHHVVALGGTGFNYYQLFLLKKYGVKKIFLLLDNDSAGQEASQRIVQKFGAYLPFEILQLPPGFKDIDEYLRKTHNTDILLVKA